MLLHVTEAKHLHDYMVEITFNNGRKGRVDLSDSLHGPVFEPLKEPGKFAQLRVDAELETIVWPNGADLAPEFLYFKAFKGEAELAPQFKAWGYM